MSGADASGPSDWAVMVDDCELATVIAVEATRLLIVGGAIPEDRETRAFMKWHDENWICRDE